MCGLYWFMDQLNRWKVQGEQVSILKLPEWEDDENGNTIKKGSWGELAPEEWHRYLDLQKSVPTSFIQCCASHWQKRKAENAPLRAVLNGALVSALEDLYDDFILREIAAEINEFQEAMIVGRVLGKYRLGIGDAWVAFRIAEMVLTGKLEVVSAAADDMSAYHRVLRKC